jgi:hypothetical protein
MILNQWRWRFLFLAWRRLLKLCLKLWLYHLESMLCIRYHLIASRMVMQNMSTMRRMATIAWMPNMSSWPDRARMKDLLLTGTLEVV